MPIWVLHFFSTFCDFRGLPPIINHQSFAFDAFLHFNSPNFTDFANRFMASTYVYGRIRRFNATEMHLPPHVRAFFAKIWCFMQKCLYLPKNRLKMVKKEVLVLKKDDEIVAFFDEMKDVAQFMGSSVSTISRSLSQERKMRLGYTVVRKPRVYLCKLTAKDYAIRNAEDMGRDWMAYLDITEVYYKGQFVWR